MKENKTVFYEGKNGLPSLVSDVKKIKYSVRDLTGINFSLYGIEYLNYEETAQNILTAFKEKYEDKIRNTLELLGLHYEGIEFYTPKYYNFNTDDLTLRTSVKEPKKMIKYIKKYKYKIQKRLDKNQSYDGYIALTVDDVKTELECIEEQGKDYEPDIIVLGTILQELIDFEEFDIVDYLVFDEDEDYA